MKSWRKTSWCTRDFLTISSITNLWTRGSSDSTKSLTIWGKILIRDTEFTSLVTGMQLKFMIMLYYFCHAFFLVDSHWFLPVVVSEALSQLFSQWNSLELDTNLTIFQDQSHASLGQLLTMEPQTIELPWRYVYGLELDSKFCCVNPLFLMRFCSLFRPSI